MHNFSPQSPSHTPLPKSRVPHDTFFQIALENETDENQKLQEKLVKTQIKKISTTLSQLSELLSGYQEYFQKHRAEIEKEFLLYVQSKPFKGVLGMTEIEKYYVEYICFNSSHKEALNPSQKQLCDRIWNLIYLRFVFISVQNIIEKRRN